MIPGRYDNQKPPSRPLNWTDPNTRLSRFFTVHEALWLPSWQIYHIPSDEEKDSIIEFAKKMDVVRGYYGIPINIHCWIRPASVNNNESSYHGMNYNIAAHSTAKNSPHITGRAVDFHFQNFSGPSGCSEMKARLTPHLDEWGLRMEDNTGAWIHLDNFPVGVNRVF